MTMLSLRVGVLTCGVVWLSGCAMFSDAETVDVREVYGSPEKSELDIVLGSCDADFDAAIDETASEVVITVTARSDTVDDCADTLVVVLNDPLGDRIVVDGGRDIEVPVDPGRS